ncbi:MAG: permease [Desulfuromonadales bacterium]|nr:permease [Desulfuromonadales bacterium]
MAAKIGSGLNYAFTDLLKDIGGWLLLGVGLAGAISALVPDGLLASIFEHQNSSLLIMLLVSVPLYMCASASTPIAASLVLKGLSPGAALVFLLAGPATNAATITVIARHWGRAATIIYLAVITVCSVAFGWMVNQLYAWADLDITRWLSQATDEGTEWWGVLCAMVLLGLIFRAFLTRETLPHHNERS